MKSAFCNINATPQNPISSKYYKCDDIVEYYKTCLKV